MLVIGIAVGKSCCAASLFSFFQCIGERYNGCAFEHGGLFFKNVVGEGSVIDKCRIVVIALFKIGKALGDIRWFFVVFCALNLSYCLFKG